MPGQPAIIQVLARDGRRIIRRWVITLGLFTAALLAIALIVALQYGQDSQSVTPG